MFRSGLICFNSSLRSSVVFRGRLFRKPFCEAARKRSSASDLQTSRQKDHGYARYLSQARSFSSDRSTTHSSLDERHTQLKNDPEIKAWMNQIAQDFEKGKEPFQISNPEQNVTLSSVSNVDQLDVNTTGGESSNHIQIEDFGYIEDDEEYEEVVPERHVPISLDRRQQGVFDVEEMVTVLEHENGIDIQVIDIPPEVRFVDHMVIVSGKSLRHMRAMAASIEWLYKQKKRKRDRPFKLEGRDCKDWFAMDLGNIAVHIFTPEARQHYDIETLWTLGPEHDDRRHYVEDDQLNLSAADLFWLETGMNQTPASQEALDSDEKKTGNAVQDRSESEQVTGTQNRNGKELQGKTSGKSDSGV